MTYAPVEYGHFTFTDIGSDDDYYVSCPDVLSLKDFKHVRAHQRTHLFTWHSSFIYLYCLVC